MLVNLNEIFDIAHEQGIGVGAFNVPTLEMLRAVVDAAESLNLPVIIQHTEGHRDFITLEEIGPIMIQYAKQSSVPVCVHLDHGASFEECARAVALGFSSVMIDASTEPYDVNVRMTQDVVRLCHAVGVSVEAELGAMLNSEIGAGEGRKQTSQMYQYTEVDKAFDFVAQTQVDCLAVAIGTVHGIYIEKPELNLKRAQEIRERVHCPLVLHGGSGLTKQSYQTAIQYGVSKINYYTYMNKAAGERVKLVAASMGDYSFFDMCAQAAYQAVFEHVREVMKDFAFMEG